MELTQPIQSKNQTNTIIGQGRSGSNEISTHELAFSQILVKKDNQNNSLISKNQQHSVDSESKHSSYSEKSEDSEYSEFSDDLDNKDEPNLSYQQNQDLKALQQVIFQMNFSQGLKYKQEMKRLFKDRQMQNNCYLGIFILVMISNQSETNQRGVPSSQLLGTTPLNQIIKYLNKYNHNIYQIFPPLYEQESLLTENFAQFVAHPFILTKLNILLRYMIINDFPNISKQFFKFIPLQILVTKIMQDDKMFNYQHAFYINLIYKLIYKHDYEFNDKRNLPIFYSTFKQHNFQIENKASYFMSSLDTKRKFSIDLVDNNFQYILIRFQQNYKQVLTICQRLFLEIINKKMYIFIADFINFQQFGLLIKDQEVFNKLIISNEGSELIILQIQILKLISRKYNLLISNIQHDQIIEKYQQLIGRTQHLERLYMNHVYILCAISLMLSQFQNNWQNKYNQYQNISILYMEMAQKTLLNIKCQQTLFLILFQNHYLQEDNLINILFQNRDHFGSILNKPIIFKVLQQLFQGNRQFSNNFFLETFQVQSLRSGYKIIVNEQAKKQIASHEETNTDFKSSLLLSIKDINERRKTIYCDLKDLESPLKKSIFNNQQIKLNRNNSRASYVTHYQPPDKQDSFTNIFHYLDRDQSNIHLTRNYIYQYNIYLHNLNFSKMYQILTLLVFFICYLVTIKNFVNTLNPAISNWKPKFETLLEWKVPPQWEGQIITKDTLIEKYKSDNYSDEEKLALVVNGTAQQFYCTHRVSHFTWPPPKKDEFHEEIIEDLKSEFYTFCKNVMVFENFRELKQADTFQILCIINIILSLRVFVSLLYQKVSHGQMQTDINIVYDLIIIVSQSTMYHQAEQFKHNFVFTKDILYFYYHIQAIGIIVTFLIYLKLLKSIKVFKQIGLYIIILQNIIAQTFYFMLYLFSLMTIIGICFILLFKGIDKEYKLYLNSILSVYLLPLGQLKLHDQVAFTELENDYTNKKTLMYIQNVLTISVTFVLMVILLNMLIALLSNMYQQVVDFTQREFSYVIFQDYKTSQPNKYYSSMELMPLTFSVLMLAIAPLMIYLKSQRLNSILNVIIYIIKFFIPFILIYWTVNLLLLPLVYFKILFCILSHSYQNQFYKPINLSFKTRLIHLLQFIFIGPFYLIYQIFVIDLIYIYKKSQEQVPERFDLIFNVQLYRIFKKTLQNCHYVDKKDRIGVSEFNMQLQNNLDDLKLVNVIQMQERLQFLQLRLRKRAETLDNGDVDLVYFLSMLSIMKNKKQQEDHSRQYWQREKNKQIEIIFNQHDSYQLN